MKLIPVVSSMVSTIGYDVESGRLVVQFPVLTGPIDQSVFWEYLAVPHYIVLNVLFAESFGKEFNRLIKKGGFENKRITAEQANA